MCADDRQNQPDAPWNKSTVGARVLATEFTSGVATHDFLANEGIAGAGWYIESVSASDSGTIAQPYLTLSLENGKVLSTFPKGSNGGLSIALPDKWNGRIRFTISASDSENDVFVLFTRQRVAASNGESSPC